MHVLYVDNQDMLESGTQLFEQHMEPLLQQLEAFRQSSNMRADLPEIAPYLEVCRWPFRKLEYSFALDALLAQLGPGDRFLDAGCGVTPFAHTLAARGVQVDACDYDARLIGDLQRLGTERIYGSVVSYTRQDLTACSYPDATFDAISCISVLEHIPAPHDQQAIAELLRILKPSGMLVLTVDFTPASTAAPVEKLAHYGQRVTNLARMGNLNEIRRGFTRKLQARSAISDGSAQQARSANQCFEITHLEHDILPRLVGQQVVSHLPFITSLRSVTPRHAKQFWDLEAGLYDNQGRRSVLPAAVILHKAEVAVLV